MSAHLGLRSPCGTQSPEHGLPERGDAPQGHIDVQERSKLCRPPLYGVLLLNDDYTPMEFVVHVLQKFFYMAQQEASHIMLQVHREGRGLCGVFPRDVAETYVSRINHYARSNDHPLLSEVEVNDAGEEDDAGD